jgi:predicted DNA-binding ribbon-helix-helix protein
MDEEKLHTSLQAYLEYRFSSIDHVTLDMVKEAKVQYRKIYQSRYRKKYRERYVQITLRIEKQLHESLQEVAQQRNIKLTTLIKQRALQQQQAFDETGINKESLLNIIDQLEEAIHEDESVSLSELLQNISSIYERLP